MGTYKSSTSKTVFRGYKSELERTIYEMNKNFYQQMDFENADAREEMARHVEAIIKSCEKLLSEIK